MSWISNHDPHVANGEKWARELEEKLKKTIEDAEVARDTVWRKGSTRQPCPNCGVNEAVDCGHLERNDYHMDYDCTHPVYSKNGQECTGCPAIACNACRMLTNHFKKERKLTLWDGLQNWKDVVMVTLLTAVRVANESLGSVEKKLIEKRSKSLKKKIKSFEKELDSVKGSGNGKVSPPTEKDDPT